MHCDRTLLSTPGESHESHESCLDHIEDSANTVNASVESHSESNITTNHNSCSRRSNGNYRNYEHKPVKGNVNNPKKRERRTRQRVAVLNVGGLASKLSFPEFDDFLNLRDIICITETKFDLIDTVDKQDFICFKKDRLRCKRKSGGIAAFVRKDVVKNIKIIENIEYRKHIDESHIPNYKFVTYPIFKDGLFLELPSVKGDQCKPLYLCIVYCPPENSPYANMNCFQELEETLLNIGAENVILAGDFNARTREMKDYVDRGDSFADENNEETLTDIMMCNFIKDRRSQDRETNNLGHKLIDFCIGQELLLLNGRKDEDAGIGKVTCKGVSVVDYVITKPHLFESVTNFSIGDYCECLSDVHCPLYFDIIYGGSMNCNDTYKLDSTDRMDENIVIAPKWKAGSEEVYLMELNDDCIERVKSELIELACNIEVIDQGNIDKITADVGDIMSTAASNLGMLTARKCKKPSNNIKKKQVKSNDEWFNDECKEKRSTFRNLKHKAKFEADRNEAKRNRNRAFKKYKQSIKKNFRVYVRNLQRKIRTMKSADAKNYWKLINGNSQDRQQIMNSISHEVFAKHFEDLCNISEDKLIAPSAETVDSPPLQNEALNKVISEDEVLKCIKKLKNNKACGYDGILNEFLKHSQPKLLSLLTLLYNLILTSGKIPESWTVGYISPIYKGKGDANNPDNYRGITIVSCFGKLFTSILNERICSYLEENSMIGQEQAGFRKGHSTIDHIFSLHCLIDLYLHRKKRLYCAFVDFRKAFDSVQHSLLWEKLLNMNICGKVLNVVRDMYKKTKLCVKHMMKYSKLFVSNIGLLQGENLSPIMFAMFINDLKTSLYDNANLPSLAQLAGAENLDDLMYLFLLLYADDTAILAETPEKMQNALDKLDEYCTSWGLQVNVDKTKIVIFSRGKVRNIPSFSLNNMNVEVVPDYVYLGVLFNFNNKFLKAQKRLCLSGNRAMFSLLRKCRKLNLPIDIQLDLFEKCVHPVVTYGCEVWGYQSLELISKFQLRFLKLALGAYKTTPSCMILGELGSYPIKIEIQCRMLAL